MACRQTKLGRHGLQQHRHQIGQGDDPEQIVPVSTAALDIGGKIAGIYVGHAGDKRRAEERKQREQPFPVAIECRTGSSTRACLFGSARKHVFDCL